MAPRKKLKRCCYRDPEYGRCRTARADTVDFGRGNRPTLYCSEHMPKLEEEN